jgi:hypothetical protein
LGGTGYLAAPHLDRHLAGVFAGFDELHGGVLAERHPDPLLFLVEHPHHLHERLRAVLADADRKPGHQCASKNA